MRIETQPILLEHRARIETLRRRYGHNTSSHAFTSLFLWQKTMGLSLHLEEDLFAVRCLWRGENGWFFPCGAEEGKLRLLHALAGVPGTALYYLRREDVDFLERRMPGRFDLQAAREDWEYLYDLAGQIQMPGRKYKNIRSKIHKARTRHRWTVSDLGPELLDQAEKVILAWDQLRGGDTEAATAGLRHYEQLGFQGVLLETEAGPQAVAFGAPITPDTFDLHVTKTLMPGIDSYLKWELYRRLPPGIKWINQEEDLGLPGLRTNKEEALPTRMIPLWKGVAR